MRLFFVSAVCCILIFGGCSTKLVQRQINNKNSAINKSDFLKIVSLDQKQASTEIAKKISEYASLNGYKLSNTKDSVSIGIKTNTDAIVKMNSFINTKYEYIYNKKECPYYNDSYDAPDLDYVTGYENIFYRPQQPVETVLNISPKDSPEKIKQAYNAIKESKSKREIYNPVKPSCSVAKIEISKCIDLSYSIAVNIINSKDGTSHAPFTTQSLRHCDKHSNIDRDKYIEIVKQQSISDIADQSIKLLFPYYTFVSIEMFDEIESVKVENSVKKQFELAVKKIDKKDYIGAIENLEDIYFQMKELTPKEVCFNLASVYEYLGMNEKALYFYSKKQDYIFVQGASRVSDKL